MPEFPHELIRQLQICTRAAVGLPDYNPDDPTLPAIPSLAATIATLDPSPPHLRCDNCKGNLLRGNESNICMYCGCPQQTDVVRQPICFTSTIAYQGLLRSLHLDGSEIVKPVTNKKEHEQGQSSPKAEIQLSDVLNFRISWPADAKKEEASISDQHSENTRRFLSFTGVAPDNFFSKSKRETYGASGEQPKTHNTTVTKEVASFESPLFQNVQSSDPSGISLKDSGSEVPFEWEADFQFADSENQQNTSKSSDHFIESSADSAIKVEESKSFGIFTGSEVDSLADSAIVVEESNSFGNFTGVEESNSFGNFTGVEESNSFGNFTGVEESNSFGNFTGVEESNSFGNFTGVEESNSFGNFTGLEVDSSADSAIKVKESKSFSNFTSSEVDSLADSPIKVEKSKSFGNFTASEVDLGSHMDSMFGSVKNINDGLPKDNPATSTGFSDWNSDEIWNNGSLNKSQLIGGFDDITTANDDHTLENPNNHSKSDDLFEDFQWQTNDVIVSENTSIVEEHKTTNEGSFDDWNDFTFTGSSSLQDPFANVLIESNDMLSTSDNKMSSEIDLFGTNSKFEDEDFGSFSEPNISASTSTSYFPAEVNVTTSEEDFGSFSKPNISSSTSNSYFPTEVNATVSKEDFGSFLKPDISASTSNNYFLAEEDFGSFSEPNIAASTSNSYFPAKVDATISEEFASKSESTKTKDDEVKILISQMHDLSFMLENELSIPSSSDTRDSSTRD